MSTLFFRRAPFQPQRMVQRQTCCGPISPLAWLSSFSLGLLSPALFTKFDSIPAVLCRQCSQSHPLSFFFRCRLAIPGILQVRLGSTNLSEFPDHSRRSRWLLNIWSALINSVRIPFLAFVHALPLTRSASDPASSKFQCIHSLESK